EQHEHPTPVPADDFIDLRKLTGEWLDEVKEICQLQSNYNALHVVCNYAELSYLQTAQRIRISSLAGEHDFQKGKVQAEEVMQRYHKISGIMQQCVVESNPLKKVLITDRIDKVLLHPLWGNVILLFVLFLMFQSIFWLAAYPMDWVEQGFSALSGWLAAVMPDNWVQDLLIN